MRDGHLQWHLPPVAWTAREAVVNVKCGHCFGCDRATQRDWSLRCYHEGLYHQADWRNSETGVLTSMPNSCIVTLTYDPEHLPKNGALYHNDFQRFMKRLRRRRERRWLREKKPGECPPIRYFMCGEYGLKGRPHYHAIIYGETFDDRYVEISLDGQINKMSYELDQAWSQPAYLNAPPTKIGRATVDDFTYAGASYVAGYVAKKQGDKHLGPWLDQVNTSTGEVTIRPLNPEYRKMSRGHKKWKTGGLGKAYCLENMLKIYPADQIPIGPWQFHPPRYYDTLLKRENFPLSDQVKLARLDKIGEISAEWTPERCSSAEKIALASFETRSQSLD